MGPMRLRICSAAWMLGALACAFEGTAMADGGPRKPVVVAGSAQNLQGLYTTADQSADIELPSRVRLHVAPNTAVRVFPLPQLLALTPGPRTWTWSFAVQNGRVDVDLPKAGRNAVLVNLGRLSAIATAGHASFRSVEGEATAANGEGELRTLLNEHWQTVPVGWQATLNKED